MKAFYKLDIKYDINELKEGLFWLKNNLPPHHRKVDNRQYGWMITSYTDDYRLGYDNLRDFHGGKHEYECVVKTQACLPVFEKILNDFKNPYRARICVYTHEASLNWHSDWSEGAKYYWRYQIPIVASPGNELTIGDTVYKLLEEGRVYKFASWIPHKVINHHPTIHRAHFMFSTMATEDEVEQTRSEFGWPFNIHIGCGVCTDKSINYDEYVKKAEDH